MTRWDKIIAGLLLILVIWLTWLFYGYFSAADANVKVSLIGLGTAIFVAIISHTYAQKREIKARQFLEKSKAYMHIFDLIFEIMKMTKEGRELTEQEMIQKSMNIKKALMVWGDQNVLRVWLRYEEEALSKPEAVLFNIDAVLREIRKDLGHDDGALKAGELFKLIVAPADWDKILNGAVPDNKDMKV